MEINWKHRTR